MGNSTTNLLNRRSSLSLLKQATGEVVDLLYQRRDVFHRDDGIGVLGGDGGHFILLSSVSLFLPGGLKKRIGSMRLSQ